MLKKPYVMLDIETLGGSSQAAIIAIGAVDNLGSEFYYDINLEDAMKYGKVDASTILFWLQNAANFPKQSEQVLHKVLGAFTSWFPKKAKLWSHATFDAVIVRNAYEALALTCPWDYHDTRDLRTFKAMISEITGFWNEPNRGTAHNALDDAHFQMQVLQTNAKMAGFELT